MNYNEEMKKIMATAKGSKLLLHSCCAPCSSSVITRLKDYFTITVIFFNPNIEPYDEYLKRKKEQLRLLEILNIPYYDIDYLNEEFTKNIKGYEKEPEGGIRCELCISQRLHKTAKIAFAEGYDYFGTTLTVSPHKNSIFINDSGLTYQRRYGIKYLIADFKKEDGYKNSIALSKKYNLYRQNYCGCRYSKGEKYEE